MSVVEARAGVEELAASLRARPELELDRVRLAFVLGSGLGAFADELEDAVSVGYDELPGMPRSTASIGSTISDSISRGDAARQPVCMLMVGFSMSGNS